MALNMRYLFSICLGCIPLLLICALPAQTPPGAVDREELTNITLGEFVTRLGDKTGTKYSIEYFGGGTLGLVPIESISPTWKPIESIEKYFPNFTVSQSRKHSSFYHVMSKKLLHVMDYALDRQIAEVRYDGPLRRYPLYLASIVDGFHAYAPGSFHDGYKRREPVPDTRFVVSLKSVSLREAFSACLDLEKSEGLCWETFTGMRKDNTPFTDFTFKRDARFKAAP
jgi:hypothetical protein